MTRKKTENVNENTIGNEIVTSDQPVNAMQGTFLQWSATQYLFLGLG